MQSINHRNRNINHQWFEVPNLLLISGLTIDPESINSWLRFFANVPLCAWNNRLGPLQNLVRCRLSDLPSFRLPVPHLGQENMVRNNNMPYLWNSNYLEKMWRRSMSHNSSISGMGEPVPAIRVLNEKWMLLIMVGINILELWERICKVSMGIHLQARAG